MKKKPKDLLPIICSINIPKLYFVQELQTKNVNIRKKYVRT